MEYMPPGPEPTPPGDSSAQNPFRRPFRLSVGTYIVLVFLVIIFPSFNLILSFLGGNDIDLSLFDPVWFFYIPTIVMLWLMVVAVALALWREKSSPPAIGLGRFTWTHLGYGIIFLFISNIILLGLQLLLTALGVPFSDLTDQLVLLAADSVGWWLALSLSAALCEEFVFRGYLLTRIAGVTGGYRWLAALIATISFATGHLYQGLGGFFVIFVYGMMFCWLYIKTGSLWPGIIAHFIQNFSAIFVYPYMQN